MSEATAAKTPYQPGEVANVTLNLIREKTPGLEAGLLELAIALKLLIQMGVEYGDMNEVTLHKKFVDLLMTSDVHLMEAPEGVTESQVLVVDKSSTH